MVLTKKVQVSQTDSKWQSSSTGRAQLAGGDVTDASGRGHRGEGGVEPGGGDPPAAFEEQDVRARRLPPVGQPLVEQGLELGMQRNVTVGVQLADGDAQPERGPDLHDGVDGQVE